MKAAVYYETGSPDVFRIEDVTDPDVGPQDVLIGVEVISIEGGDVLSRWQGDLVAVPHVVGYQCAGPVQATGVEVRDIGVGDRVVTVGLDGSHAELRSVPESFCWRIPEDLSTEEAACVPIPFGTAWDCLFEFGRLRAGETVLVQAGASGVGISAIQLAKRAGARVLATASSPARLERLGELGLDHGIDYTTVNFVDEVRRLTDGSGADVIVDSVGGATLQQSLACLAYRGRCLTFGDAGRDDTSRFDISSLRGNNQSLIGYFMGAELLFGSRMHETVGQMLTDVARGDLRVVIDKRFTLAQVADAHRYIESRKAFGRVVLLP